MKTNVKPRKTTATAKPIILTGSRQVVESAIDASKAARNRTWDASARVARNRRVSQKTCYEGE